MDHQFRDNLNRSPTFNTLVTKSIQDLFPDKLNPETLDFFHVLAGKDLSVFEELRAEIAHYKKDGLFLKASHIDTVVQVLQKQRQLPADIETLLQTHYSDAESQNKMKSTLSALRKNKLPWLNTQASENNYGHHTLYHASEIKVRATRAAKTLGLFIPGHSTLANILPLFRFAIEFHDYIQGKPGDAILGKYGTAELATAAAVKSWLFSSEDDLQPQTKPFDDLPADLKNFFDLLIDNTIVLATTLVFSKKKCQHLAGIFSMFEEKSLKAGIRVIHPENMALMNEIQAMNIVIGASDVLAASMHTVVQQQLDEVKTHSLQTLKTYFAGERLVLEDFFASEGFKPYFPTASLEVNYEAFLMTNVPHLEMGAELKIIPLSNQIIPFMLAETSDKASLIIYFIRECQKIYRENPSAFNDFFERKYKEPLLSEAVNDVFFSHIEPEIEFITSLAPLITQGQKKLQALGRVNERGEPVNDCTGNTPQTFIDPEVPQIDARNLHALSVFFNMEATNKNQLIKEFLLNAVFQAGTTYIASPELAAESTVNTPLNFGTSAQHKNLENYVTSWNPGIFHSKSWTDLNREPDDWDEYKQVSGEYESDDDMRPR